MESLLLDVTRLDERIGKLRGHFDQANNDIELIETSSRKIGSRGEKITSLEVEAESGSDLLDNKGHAAYRIFRAHLHPSRLHGGQ